MRKKLSKTVASMALALLLGACAMGPDSEKDEPRQTPIKPVDAFEEVDQPLRGADGFSDQPDALSQDIERLQDAKRKYQAERDFEAAERRRRQALCRESGEGRETPIEDGSAEPAVYCQLNPESSRSAE